jgi:Flp pilus assembly secretin CpaC
MTSKMARRANPFRAAPALLLLAVATLMPRPALAAEELRITLDQATIMRLPEKVSTIVVGNPLIADIAVQSGGLVVVTGKGYGSTNFIVLDRAGAVLMELGDSAAYFTATLGQSDVRNSQSSAAGSRGQR